MGGESSLYGGPRPNASSHGELKCCDRPFLPSDEYSTSDRLGAGLTFDDG